MEKRNLLNGWISCHNWRFYNNYLINKEIKNCLLLKAKTRITGRQTKLHRTCRSCPSPSTRKGETFSWVLSYRSKANIFILTVEFRWIMQSTIKVWMIIWYYVQKSGKKISQPKKERKERNLWKSKRKKL